MDYQRLKTIIGAETQYHRNKATRAETREPDRFQSWYAENSDALLERRRAKYHADPEHRARILASNSRSKRRGSDGTP